MRSSLVVVLHAVVLIACLTALAVLTVNGPALPERILSLLPGKSTDCCEADGSPRDRPAETPAEATSLSDPRLAEPVNLEVHLPPAESAVGGEHDPGAPEFLLGNLVEPEDVWISHTTVPVFWPPAPEEPMVSPRVPSIRRVSFTTQPSSTPADSTSFSNAKPTDHGQPPVTRSAVLREAAPPAEDGESVYVQLQRLGASYYRLERWSREGEMFKFRCEVPLPGKPGKVRFFETQDPDPQQAAQRVLAEVKSWVNSQAQGPANSMR